MSDQNVETSPVSAPPRDRLIVGLTVLFVGQLAPLLVPIIVATQWSTVVKSVLSGFLLLGAPELAILGAAAILGKEGFDYLRARIFALFKKYGPPNVVSPTRYRVGLVMFTLPLLYALIWPYLGHAVSVLNFEGIFLPIIGDTLFFASLFVLGGDFWDKLRALFVHGAKVTIEP
ncbi:MAG: hypothetical protein OCC46_00265 [Pseudodesulfovibrio sp.]